MLAGNVVALLSPMIFIPILTYAFGPQNYDWESMKLIRRVSDDDIAAANNVDLELIPGEAHTDPEAEALEQSKLKRASVIAKSLTAFMTLAMLVLWPMPLYGSGYVFSKKFFTGWVSVGILWLFCSSFCVGLYPLWEGRHSMAHTFRGIVLDIRGKRKPTLHGREGVVEDDSEGSRTPFDDEKKVAPTVEKASKME